MRAASKKIFIVLILIACLLYILQQDASCNEKMILVYFDDFPPFSWKDDKGQVKGILPDILTEALQKRMGIAVEHRGYPWARAQDMVRAGQADGFCTVPTNARRRYTIISKEAVMQNQVTIFTWKGNPKVQAMRKARGTRDLKGYTHVQYAGNGWAEGNLKGMNILWVSSMAQVLEMIAAKRVDLTAASKFATNYKIKQMGLREKIIEIPVVLDANTLNLCIGKNSPFVAKVFPAFDRVMGELKQDGTLTRIIARYADQ